MDPLLFILFDSIESSCISRNGNLTAFNRDITIKVIDSFFELVTA